MDDVEAIHNLLRNGKSNIVVATELGISLEMVACAERKWPQLNRLAFATSIVRFV